MSKKSPQAAGQSLTPSEVKALAREYFNKLLDEGNSPWPHIFLEKSGYKRKTCPKCQKNFWYKPSDAVPEATNCGDSTCCGGYSFLHPETPPAEPLSYYGAWEGFQKSFKEARIPHGVAPRYPVVARWRSDVDFVAAGIYCFQPYCVTGESDPPYNPLIASQFCLRFNDLDNIGRTGRHFSGFNMLGIQVFNNSSKTRSEPSGPYGETEEIYWKDSCIEFCFNWATQTLHLAPEGLTFIEDVWQGGGNCGSCVEFFYGGLEIGNMVFTEYAVSPTGAFTLIDTKVIDVGIGLERIPWLINGNWTSYLSVFDYMLPQLSEKLEVPIDTPEFRNFANYTGLFDVDENSDIEGTWMEIKQTMKLDDAGLAKLKSDLDQFADLIILCDHTRTCLYAIEDGALPSPVGGGSNIRNVLRRIFSIIEKRGWFDKLGGVQGLIDVFKMHIAGLKCFTEFHNIKCLEDVIALEYDRWKSGKSNGISSLISLVMKRLKEAGVKAEKDKKGNIELSPEMVAALKTKWTFADWFTCVDTYGLTPEEIHQVTHLEIQSDLYKQIDDQHYRTAKPLPRDLFNVTGVAPTIELFNEPGNEHRYELDAKIVHTFNSKCFACDQTVMYATQGGQNHDEGTVTIDGKDYELDTIEKVRNVVIFVTKDELPGDIVGKACHQKVDRDVREILRVQHTATHVVAAAARRVLGPHVWQNGAKKTKTGAHIDLTHFQSLTYDQLLEIDRVANEIVLSGVHVSKKIYTRKEAEGRWGFVLYQGGAIPGNSIRVVDIDGVDTEACCGTHVDNLSEIGQIKINSTTRISDGVLRIEFVAGRLCIPAHHEDMIIVRELQQLFGCAKEEILKNSKRFFQERNAFNTQVKSLTDDLLRSQIATAVTKGDRVIVRRKETNASIFIKGLETHFASLPQAKGKSLIVVGEGFIYGLVQEALYPALEAALKPVLASAKANLGASKKKGKSEFVPISCMKFELSIAKAVNDALASLEFVE